MIRLKTLWEKKFKAGYVLKRQSHKFQGKEFEKTYAYNNKGEWIGDSILAYNLCKKRGIAPEKVNKNHNICSIGFCEKENKWYGWSHRAGCGFGIGDKIYKERFKGSTDTTPFIKHGDITIIKISQAKIAAIRFAKSVS